MWPAFRANGTRRARPLRVPSGPSVIRPSAWMGAIVNGPFGTGIPARVSSQPAIKVSASGTGEAKRPATRNTANPSPNVAPAPPNSSGTQVNGKPDASSAVHSAFGQMPFSASLTVLGSQRSWKIRVAVSTMMLSVLSFMSLSAPASTVFDPRAAKPGREATPVQRLSGSRLALGEIALSWTAGASPHARPDARGPILGDHLRLPQLLQGRAIVAEEPGEHLIGVLAGGRDGADPARGLCHLDRRAGEVHFAGDRVLHLDQHLALPEMRVFGDLRDCLDRRYGDVGLDEGADDLIDGVREAPGLDLLAWRVVEAHAAGKGAGIGDGVRVAS